jgi:Mrp family chromosome partitioning ATPase
MQPPGAAAKRGLTDLLVGSAAPEDVIQTDAVTKLDFIAAGEAMSGPFGAEEIARLKSAIGVLKRSYSLIVIDSPPLLAMTDGLVLGNIADQTVFVCRWQQTSRKAVTASLERLHAYGAQVSGIVVSMVDANSTLAFGDDYSRREIGQISRLYGAES